MIALIRNLNALLIYMLCGILLGAYAIQIFMGEVPCSLCLLQRLGMVGVAFGASLNLRFGLRPAHYAVILGMATFGGGVALRQICLHICPGFPTFGIPVWGLSLYTWSFLTFASTILYVAILLLLQNGRTDAQGVRMNLFAKIALGLILLVALANGVTTFLECGWGPCVDH
ncbi:MAG: disulfide bond formation protein B [Parachlamydiales bacterium]